MGNKSVFLTSKMLLLSSLVLVLLFVFGAIARSKVSDRAGAGSKTRTTLASVPATPAHASKPARPQRNTQCCRARWGTYTRRATRPFHPPTRFRMARS